MNKINSGNRSKRPGYGAELAQLEVVVAAEAGDVLCGASVKYWSSVTTR